MVPAFVPAEFHALLPLVEQFGIGDDPAREIAIDMMPPHFVLNAAELVKEHRAALDDWLEAGEWTEERNAFCCLLQAIDYATIKPVHSNVVPLEKFKAMREILRKLKEE